MRARRIPRGARSQQPRRDGLGDALRGPRRVSQHGLGERRVGRQHEFGTVGAQHLAGQLGAEVGEQVEQQRHVGLGRDARVLPARCAAELLEHLGHPGLRVRGDRVDADPDVGEFGRPRVGERGDRGLRRPVHGRFGTAHLLARGDVDQDPVTLGTHRRDSGVSPGDGAEHVDLEHPAHRGLGLGAGAGHGEDAGVVDEAVEPAVLGEAVTHEVVGARPVRDVGDPDRALAVSCGELPAEPLESLRVDVDGDHVGPGRGDAARVCRSQPVGGAGDEDDAAGEQAGCLVRPGGGRRPGVDGRDRAGLRVGHGQPLSADRDPQRRLRQPNERLVGCTIGISRPPGQGRLPLSC